MLIFLYPHNRSSSYLDPLTAEDHRLLLSLNCNRVVAAFPQFPQHPEYLRDSCCSLLLLDGVPCLREFCTVAALCGAHTNLLTHRRDTTIKAMSPTMRHAQNCKGQSMDTLRVRGPSSCHDQATQCQPVARALSVVASTRPLQPAGIPAELRKTHTQSRCERSEQEGIPAAAEWGAAAETRRPERIRGGVPRHIFG